MNPIKALRELAEWVSGRLNFLILVERVLQDEGFADCPRPHLHVGMPGTLASRTLMVIERMLEINNTLDEPQNAESVFLAGLYSEFGLCSVSFKESSGRYFFQPGIVPVNIHSVMAWAKALEVVPSDSFEVDIITHAIAFYKTAPDHPLTRLLNTCDREVSDFLG